MIHRVAIAVHAWSRALKSRRGQALVEYAMILAFISVLTIVIMSGIGVQLRVLFDPIISAMNAARTYIGG